MAIELGVAQAACPHPTGAVALLPEIRTQASEPSRKHAAITPRENDVLCWLAAAKSDGEIARILNISSSTVGKHIEHIYSKLGVENRTAAASLYPARGDDENTSATPPIGARARGDGVASKHSRFFIRAAALTASL